MISDEKLLDILVKEDAELAKYVEVHREIHRRIEEMTKKISLSPSEQGELKKLKKEKLAGRDRIAMILDDYRKNKRAILGSDE
jgi:uncharacterized protein YdcH (DUF465 family)